MDQIPVRVGVFPAEKDAQGCFVNPNCRYPGAEVEIVQLVFALMNIPYVIVNLLKDYDVAYDFGTKLENGSWTGVMRLLVEGQIDMSGLSMRMTEERREDVLFSYPTRVFQSVYIVTRPSVFCPRTFVFNSFSRTTWIFILIFSALSFLCLYFINISHNFITYHSALLSEAFRKSFRFPASSVVFPAISLNVSLLFMIFVVTQIYQSKMYAYLATPNKLHIPFYSQREALDYVMAGHGFFTAFDVQTLLCSTESGCRRFREVLAKKPVSRQTDQRGIEEDLSIGGIYQSAIDGALLPSAVTWLDKSQQDSIVIRDEDGQAYHVGFSFGKQNKKLRDRFNQALMQMLPAVSHITSGHGYDTKKVPIQSEQPTLEPLSFRRHLQQLFKLFVIGIGVCVVFFIVELLYHKFRSYIHVIRSREHSDVVDIHF